MLKKYKSELDKIIKEVTKKVNEIDWELEQRLEGDFPTPPEYAELAHDYLKKVIPDRYTNNGQHHSMYDDYNWYDPCCGEGNLTAPCPADMKGGKCLSTLNEV